MGSEMCIRDSVELGVDADAVDLIGIDDAEVAEQANPRGQFVIVGDDGTAFDSVEQFRGVKTQGADIAPVVDRPALVQDAEGMGAVIDDLQVVLARDLFDALHIAGVAEYMSRDDGRGVPLDVSFDLLRVEVPGIRIDIGEDRPDAFPLQRTGGGDEAERGSDGTAGDCLLYTSPSPRDS